MIHRRRWRETLEVLGDRELMGTLCRSLEEMGRGETIAWDDAKATLSLSTPEERSG